MWPCLLGGQMAINRRLTCHLVSKYSNAATKHSIPGRVPQVLLFGPGGVDDGCSILCPAQYRGYSELR